MSYTYTLLEKAQAEYESSLLWYRKQSIQAAERFISAVDNTLELICEHPDRWRNPYKKYRELSLKKYPYSIIYTIEASKKEIVVHSVYHHSRNPKKKYTKIVIIK